VCVCVLLCVCVCVYVSVFIRICVCECVHKNSTTGRLTDVEFLHLRVELFHVVWGDFFQEIDGTVEFEVIGAWIASPKKRPSPKTPLRQRSPWRSYPISEENHIFPISEGG
jgi:hypothetical protein